MKTMQHTPKENAGPRYLGQVFRTQEEVTIWGSSIQQQRPRKAIRRDEDECDAWKRYKFHRNDMYRSPINDV
jgi:hypothetical protein